MFYYLPCLKHGIKTFEWFLWFLSETQQQLMAQHALEKEALEKIKIEIEEELKRLDEEILEGALQVFPFQSIVSMHCNGG